MSAESSAKQGLKLQPLLRFADPPHCLVSQLWDDATLRRHLHGAGWGNDFVWLSKLYDEAGLIPRFRVESSTVLLPTS